MAKNTGFMTYERINPPKRPIEKRINDYNEFEGLIAKDTLQQQATRCMDCGIPFCHSFGCPLKNRIPDWNDMIYKGQWQKALDLLHATNNFPEFTGRICPEPCEKSCTLSINQQAVTIRQIELQIIEYGWKHDYIKPIPALQKTGKSVAIIGSGPAGLAAAQQLSRSGHHVIVFEKSDKIGGLLRYGIPDFKLEKWIIDRRLEQLKKEGVIFETNVKAGSDISARYMLRTFDTIALTCGSAIPRDLDIPGRNLPNIHFAMDYLIQQNKKIANNLKQEDEAINAKGKYVTVIGGGDTGSDCVGTARRQGAKEITQIEILPKPPQERMSYNPWPLWPETFRTSSSQQEGCVRIWSVLTEKFIGDHNGVSEIQFIKLNWASLNGAPSQSFTKIPDSQFKLKADLVLLAMGFTHPEKGRLISDLNINLNNKNNIEIDKSYMTSIPGVFAAGDCVMGASLVVKAIYQGRELARNINQYLLMNAS